MAVYTIQPNQVFPLALTGRWLSILSVTGALIGQSESGIKPFSLKSGYKVDVLEHETLEIVNNSAQAATIELELNNVKIESASGGEVSILGDIRVSEIVNGITVTANATVENGTMQLNEPNVIANATDVNVPAGTVVQVVAARNAKGRKVQISNVSATPTVCRVGATGVTATQGTPLIGSINAPSSWMVPTRAAIFVRNTSAEAATISVTEFYSND